MCLQHRGQRTDYWRHSIPHYQLWKRIRSQRCPCLEVGFRWSPTMDCIGDGILGWFRISICGFLSELPRLRCRHDKEAKDHGCVLDYMPCTGLRLTNISYAKKYDHPRLHLTGGSLVGISLLHVTTTLCALQIYSLLKFWDYWIAYSTLFYNRFVDSRYISLFVHGTCNFRWTFVLSYQKSDVQLTRLFSKPAKQHFWQNWGFDSFSWFETPSVLFRWQFVSKPTTNRLKIEFKRTFSAKNC